MKITFVISSLSAGGAERVISIMANYWAKKKWEITLLTFDNGATPPFYELHPRVRHIPLGIASYSPNAIAAVFKNLHCVHVLRGAIGDSKPEAVISFMDTVSITALLATRGLNVPVLVSERTNPLMPSIKKVWQQIRWWVYSTADYIVVQTKGAGDYFLPKFRNRVCVIPNPVLLPLKDMMSSDKPLEKPSLIAMGRLSQEKGFDLLMQSFASIQDRFPEWSLTILGEGALRKELEHLRDELGLTHRVHLPGQVKNPYELLMQADLFVMSSRFEGFPNALCEAMASGLPVIATDCPSGPREIIRDQVDGILVPNGDSSALSSAMARLMSDETERKRLASRAVEVTERFGLEKVMGMWETLLGQVTR